MSVHVMAVIVDHSIHQRKPRLIQCDVDHWSTASSAILDQYITDRRRVRKYVDIEQVQLMSLTVCSPPPRRRK